MLSSTSTLPGSPYTIKPEGAAAEVSSCWLCLEEGSDASGKPPVRNCSCRGTSGYAHVSCVINYAEHKGRQCYGSTNQNSSDVCRYFKCCPNCNQEYQNDVQSDLSKAMVSFVERKLHDGTPRASHLRIIALLDRLFVLSSGAHEEGSSEGQVICSKLMFLMDGMDSAMKAKTYYALGCFHGSIGSLKKAKGYLETARNLLQDADSDTSSVSDIAEIELKLNGSNTSIDVDSLRKQYEETLAKSGRETTLTIDAGVSLAKALCSADRSCEAEKLLVNLVATSRRVHGQDHNCTKSALKALQGLTLEVPSSIDSEFGDIEGWFQSI
ncbi:hypothetical protein ACHAWT_010771 [Skeletonema menzelii]